MLVAYLADRRLTFEMKCDGLDAEGITRRSVPPSNLSLLGLMRHLTDVERHWFRQEMMGEDAPDLYDEAAVDGATADPAAVRQAWREEVVISERLVAASHDLGARSKRRLVLLREVLIHVIEGVRAAQRARRFPARADRRTRRAVASAVHLIRLRAAVEPGQRAEEREGDRWGASTPGHSARP